MKNKRNVAIAIVDETGNLIYLARIDDTQAGSVSVAIGKARTSALFERPSEAFEDGIAGGRNAIPGLSSDVLPIQGGLPIMSGGRVIGVSGVTSQQDEQVAKAGADTVK